MNILTNSSTYSSSCLAANWRQCFWGTSKGGRPWNSKQWCLLTSRRRLTPVTRAGYGSALFMATRHRYPFSTSVSEESRANSLRVRFHVTPFHLKTRTGTCCQALRSANRLEAI